ncbi:MAG TPA: aminotransferase class V-fold PLP-dependent enzyme [Candidatus Copromonas faecavium]|uniref:cysteine desulfurase n=1 Tax=Candidatus Copromonas faecavium (nom. illeg.) TaxID=2840740 RepID=A0A9D1A253_9FIRM|nr:aminotransferase class V-fold PLP-dependent enzyme [Candidatus Copromonas faecavium]
MGIYLDNAATTMQKPDCVIEAVAQAMGHMGNSGRGAYGEALDASRMIYETREQLSSLFGLGNPKQAAFSCNSTEALNTAILGLLGPGDHVISTVMEHNSVLRPLYRLEKEGAQISFCPCDEKGRLRMEELPGLVKKNTKALVCTHASNLTGNANDLMTLGAFCKERGLLFIVDASQTAGVLPIDMKAMNIDVVCFTGHKSLYGPQGTGGLCVREGLSIRPLKSGGSGVHTYLKEHPPEMPTALEAGTLNGHGIAGLHAALQFLSDTGIENIHRHEMNLLRQFYQGIREIPGIRVYGDLDTDYRAAVLALNIGDYDSSEVSDELSYRYGISTRPGAHCAPLMHQSMGTVDQGMVRFSFSWFNTKEEVDLAIQAIRELAEE